MAEQREEHDRRRADGPDALEAELASFQPRAISPALRQRIGSDVADRRPRLRIVPTLAALAAAACVIFGVVLSRGGSDGATDPVAVKPPVPLVPAPPVTGPATAESSPPTLIEYRRAFAASPAALDELLAWPAGRGRSAAADVATAFSRSATLSNATLNGDSR